MSAPRVSIIVPAFDAATTLGATLTGALTQTYPDVEIVVCDDGSRDETSRILDGYGTRLRVVRQENAGLSAARNAAIEAATGELVALCDADDVLLPRHVERAVEVWRGAGTERAFVAANGWFLGREGILPDPILRGPGVGPSGQRMAMLEQNVATIFSTFPVAMWRELGGFSTDLTAMEDYDLWLRAVFAGYELHYVPEPTALYRLTPGSMSSNRERMNAANHAVRLRLATSGVQLTAAERAFLDLSRSTDWFGYSIDLAADALAAGDSREAARLLRSASRVKPSDRRLRLKAELLGRAAPLTARFYRAREERRLRRGAR